MQSTSRLLQLRSELMNAHRGDSSIDKFDKFLDRVNRLVNTLLSGASIFYSDFVAIILNNVRPAYESNVAFAQAREEVVSYSALEGFLLGVECR